MKWNEYFFKMCEFVAQKSKDPNTKVGCVIVGPDKEIRSTGFNGFPRGVKDDVILVPKRYERPEKYQWTEHSEQNAICAAAKMGTSLDECDIYVTWMPCVTCAKSIIQCGIKNVYILKYSNADDINWPQFYFGISKQMFIEAGVNIYIENYDGNYGKIHE